MPKTVFMSLFVFILSFFIAVFSSNAATEGSLQGTPAPNHEVLLQKKPNKIMIIIHGGGWLQGGEKVLNLMKPYEKIWHKKGWSTVSIDHRSGAYAVPDVLATYDLVRKKFGKKATICAVGQSSGGHLSLMLAGKKTSLDCAISEAGPTDLGAYKSADAANQVTWNPIKNRYDTVYSTMAFDSLVTPAFGTNLEENSPINYLSTTKALVHLNVSQHDLLIPPRQIVQYQEKANQTLVTKGRVSSLIVPSGDEVDWVHAKISKQSYNQLLKAEYKTAQKAVLENTTKLRLLRKTAHLKNNRVKIYFQSNKSNRAKISITLLNQTRTNLKNKNLVTKTIRPKTTSIKIGLSKSRLKKLQGQKVKVNIIQNGVKIGFVARL